MTLDREIGKEHFKRKSLKREGREGERESERERAEQAVNAASVREQ